MMDGVPLALKQADGNLAKCGSRAAQLNTVKPIVAYWCEYWVVNQILAKGLHNTDGEVLEYTTNLMDKLEKTKTEYASEVAVTDDAAAQAYIEQFAQETLDRAQRVVKANKVTAQTANTFDAAATFFNLVHIWGTPDQETLQKIKYAKWNATRIFKALKEGRDPNESNPKPEELPAPPPTLDSSDPEVQLLAGGPKPVTLEDVPDTDLRRDSAGVSLPHTPVSTGHPATTAPGQPTAPEIPPADPASSQAGAAAPANAGYFDSHSAPRAPSPMSPSTQSATVYHPTGDPQPIPGWAPTPSPPAAQSAFSPPPPVAHQPPPAAAPPTFAPSPHVTPAVAPPPVATSPNPNYMDMAPTAHLARPTIPAPSAPSILPMSYKAPAQAPVPAPASIPVVVDSKAMVEAQKHAKWAISALNFDDVPTAIRELRRALEKLGAS